MGSYGSTRWGWYLKKTQVEECLKFSIFSIKDYLHPGFKGDSYWYRTERDVASISYHVLGGDKPTSVRLVYSITQYSGEKTNLNYAVRLSTTPLAWGG